MFPLKDANPRHGPSPVTWALLIVNCAVFVYTLSLQSNSAITDFILTFGFIPGEFFGTPVPEGFTLFSSMFLHGGVMHILGNMLFLFVFGDNVEDRMGHLGFLVFYLAGGMVATLAHGAFAVESALPMVGASGAISAVLGAYMMLFPRQRVLTLIPPLFLPWAFLRLFRRFPRFFMPWLPAWFYIGYWAFLQFFEAANGLVLEQTNMDVSNVAWWAHVGGFVFGVLSVRLFVKPRGDFRVEAWPPKPPSV